MTDLIYTVHEYTKTTSFGGWGESETTKQCLVPSKSFSDMTDREQELAHRVDTDRVPDGAAQGDTFTFDDLLADPRTNDEREADALDEAAETGEAVVITKTTTRCNDARKECNLDHVATVATPDGDIETRRTHTY